MRGLRANRLMASGVEGSASPGKRPGLSISIRSSKMSTRVWSPMTLYDRWTTALTKPSSHAGSGTIPTGPNFPSSPSAVRVGTRAALRQT